MIVRFAPRAVADLADIADYVRNRNPSAAIAIEAAIRKAVDSLGALPLIGIERPGLGVRALGVPRFPYTIYYRLRTDTIEIVHIRDDRRQPIPQDGT